MRNALLAAVIAATLLGLSTPSGAKTVQDASRSEAGWMTIRDDRGHGWRGNDWHGDERRGDGRDSDWRDDDHRGYGRSSDWRGDRDWDERGAYRDGFRRGRDYDDRFEDRRIYRDGFRDGRSYDGYNYQPHFYPRFDYGRHSYYRYDEYRGPWRRPYIIGRPLPRGLGYRRVEPYFYGLPPCPRGYYYADVGGDILLIALATGIIADALVY